MSETNKNNEWLNFQIKTDWIIKSKKTIDKNGNVIVPIKILGLAEPYGTIKINSNCIHLSKYSNDYASVGIIKTREYMFWDKEGVLSPIKILGLELAMHLSKMQEIVEKIKARNKNIFFQNQKNYKKHIKKDETKEE